MYVEVKTDEDASKLSNLLKTGNWMVLYYAEWCGHCQAMKPEWQKVVESMTAKHQAEQKINIADVISDQIPHLTHKPDIKGFPTINIYINGKRKSTFSDSSPRDAANIRKFAMDNAVIHPFAPIPAPIKHSKKSTKKSRKTQSRKNHSKSRKNNKKNNVMNNTAMNKRASGELPMIELANSSPPSVQVDNSPVMPLPEPAMPPQEPASLDCESLTTREACKNNSDKCYYDFKEFKCKRKTGKKQKRQNNQTRQNNPQQQSPPPMMQIPV